MRIMKSSIMYGGLTCEPGKKVQGMVPIGDSGLTMPLTLINGVGEGKTVLLSTGIHGGEYPSIESVIELAAELMPQDISGQLIIYHPMNVEGFYQRVSYISPIIGANLNRKFPGKADGDAIERIAYYMTQEYTDRCDFVIDTHGGDLHEYLPPYVYYPGIGPDETVEESRQAALVLNAKYMVKSSARDGLYNSAGIRGIPGVLIERGCRGLWTKADVEAYKFDIKNVMRHLKLLKGEVKMPEKPATLITRASYLDAQHSGCWYPDVELEQRVKQGQRLGVIKDFFGNVLEEVYAEFDAIVVFLTVSLAIAQGDPIITYGI